MPTRIILTAGLLITIVIAGSGLTLGGQTKYGVTVKAANADALAKASTYRWGVGHPALSKTVHKHITDAIDRELQMRGLKHVENVSSDIVVLYSSLSRMDTDLKPRVKEDETLRQYAVGTLAIDLRDRKEKSSLFLVRMDTPIDLDPVKLKAAVNAVVAAMFEKYPTPEKD